MLHKDETVEVRDVAAVTSAAPSRGSLTGLGEGHPAVLVLCLLVLSASWARRGCCC